MTRYGLIQLSDLQFGEKHRFEFPSKIVNQLSDDILTMAEKHKFIPIYLLLTGDIAETAHSNEYEDASGVIERLSLKIGIDKDSILAIPGNHDINWTLSKIANDVGDPNLKYNLYNKFAERSCNELSIVSTDEYKRYIDHRLGIEILLINSCEVEDHERHFGFINKDKLLKSITNSKYKSEGYTKICMCHHRIDSNKDDIQNVVDNSYEIETILIENGYSIVFTGHIHENRCFEITHEGKKIIYSGAGSAGVNSTQRIDGIPNQYSIHILDSYNKKVETHIRAFNPQIRNKYGLGAWTSDNSMHINPALFDLPDIIDFDAFSSNSMENIELKDRYKIKRNPFTFTNAEKIQTAQLIQLFVSNENRNKGATRSTGDAIIRGSRGSGKTMLLRYLEIIGNYHFDNNVRDKIVSESFPIMVNLSLIHNSEWKGSIDNVIESAERLIFESVINALDQKSTSLNLAEFKSALFRTKQKLSVLNNQQGSAIWKLGVALKENMSNYFSHILLLIDEVAPVFPKEFFGDGEKGFLRWMNNIRNSGPYFTRIAVYPNDLSDILNEDRFGTIVNLDYNIKSEDDYLAYRAYCINLVNRYLQLVSIDKMNPTKISNIIEINDESENDSLEQLIYASDGSSRRFTSLMDKCITYSEVEDITIFNKKDILNVIKEFSNNLLTSYDLSEREIAQSLAKVCRKQITYRFRLPNLSGIVTALHAKNEELNIVKLAEIGTGRRGTTYEFTYPYCILMDIQTHYLKDSRKICLSRDRITGEWISQATTIAKEQIDYLNKELRLEGIIVDLSEDFIIIKDIVDQKEFISETFDSQFKVGAKVTFIHIDGIASDICKID